MRHPDPMPRFWFACGAMFGLVLLAGLVTMLSAWVLGAGWVMP